MKTVYIEKHHSDDLPINLEAYMAFVGFSHYNCDVNLIRRQDLPYIDGYKTLCGYGTLDFTKYLMEQSYIQVPKNIDYILDHKDGMYGRRITTGHGIVDAERLNDLFSFYEADKFFIKPKYPKAFHASVIGKTGSEDILTVSQFLALNQGFLDQPVFYNISNYVKFESEWRLYIHNKKIVGGAHYKGQFALESYYDPYSLDTNLDLTGIMCLLNNYKEDLPAAFVIDVGIIDHHPYIIEFNDFWSIGCYGGISSQTFVDLLYARWYQLRDSSPYKPNNLPKQLAEFIIL